MQTSQQITFRDLPHSEAVENHIKEKINKLQKFFDKIISCDVVLELSTKNQHRGNLYDTHITVRVPGKKLVTKINENEQMYLSINRAFDDMERLIEAYVEQLKGYVKTHQPIVTGTIVRLFEGDGFGFIEKGDGSEYYFNAASLLSPPFHKLSIGMPVHFVGSMGSDGPQAHRVKAIDKKIDKE